MVFLFAIIETNKTTFLEGESPTLINKNIRHTIYGEYGEYL